MTELQCHLLSTSRSLRIPKSHTTGWSSLVQCVLSLLPTNSSLICSQDLDILIRRSNTVMITAEVKRYLQNIVVFLRLHRAVAGGISARATKHFDLLVK